MLLTFEVSKTSKVFPFSFINQFADINKKRPIVIFSKPLHIDIPIRDFEKDASVAVT